MTLIPPGAQLAPVDPPPPPPHQDPREPPATISRRGNRTPTRPHSPAPPTSRGASPSRPPLDGVSPSDTSIPLRAPSPRYASPSPSTSPGRASPFNSTLPTSTPNASSPIPLGAIPSHPSASAIFGHHLSRPSSPSSIHSSTSAIFERDIEFPPVQALSLSSTSPPAPGQTLSHKPSRLSFAHGSALDHTVPAVLDDAVEALSNTDIHGVSRGLEGLEIEAPAPSLGGTIGGGQGGISMARQSSASLQSGLSSRKVSQSLSPGPGSGTGPIGISSGLGFPPPGNNTRSGSSSPVSMNSMSRSSLVSPAATSPPPLLGQISPSNSENKVPSQNASTGTSPVDGRAPSLTGVMAESGKGVSVGVGTGESTEADKERTLTPTRPQAVQRTSTGKQLPGGWMSTWNQSDTSGTATGSSAGVLSQGNTVSLDDNEGSTQTTPVPPSISPRGTSALVPQSQQSQTSLPVSPGPAAALPSHLSPAKDKRRISFISYNDLLLSVPTEVTQLKDITTGQHSPDHMAGTVSPSLATVGAMSTPGVGRSPSIGGLPDNSTTMAALADGVPGGPGGPGGVGGVGHKPSWDAGSHGARGLGLGDGEWGREGLGRGLEQRLEELTNEGQT